MITENKSVIDIFKKLVKEKNDEVFIIQDDKKITYRDIDEISEKIAAEIKKYTIGYQNRILLSLGHTYNIIAAIIAVLKTGNVYVPIDIKVDNERIGYISDNCNSNLIICDKAIDINIKQVNINLIKSEETCIGKYYKYKNEDEVYILFTSGSTGYPKGVSITYANLWYILKNMERICPTDTETTYCFSTPYTFDVSTTEIYGWINGGKVAIIDTSDYTNYRKFPQFVYKNNITHLAISPSGFVNMLRVYSEEEQNNIANSLEYLMVAGEEFKESIYKVWNEKNWKFRLFNLYGPTEATVYALGYELKHGQVIENGIPIGKPLDGARYYIDNIAENGVGELILLGEGIARGYINNPEENRKRFKEKDGVLSYRTGDLVHVKDGIVFYNCRNDDQVQINGIRVELGEIEHRIRMVDEINDACVAEYNGIIISHIVLNEDANMDERKALEKISKCMPRYMVPNYIKIVDKIVLNKNNKADRKYIVESYLNCEATNNRVTIDNNKVLGRILSTMKKVLGVENDIREDDDFFSLGADSLDVFTLLVDLEKIYNREIDPSLIYIHRTAREIVDYFKNNCDTSLKAQNDSLLDYEVIVDLTNQVQKNIYDKSDQHIGSYKSLYLQQMYYHNKFNSFLSFDIDLGTNYTLDEIREGVKELCKKNKVLRSCLYQKNGILEFNEYEIEDKESIPYVKIRDNCENFISFIKKNYSNEMFWSRYHGGFLALFVIVECNNSFNVVGILDHCIVDGSCINILKKKLLSILEGNEQTDLTQYSDYCKYVGDKMTVNVLKNHWYYKEIIKCLQEDKKGLLNQLEDENCVIRVTNVENYENTNANIIASYVLSHMFIEKTGFDVAVRTLFNIREANNYRFSDVIGDVHVGISFINNASLSYEKFKKLALNVIDIFSKDVFQPKQAFECSFPRYTAEQLRIKEIWDKCELITVNYLGVISKDKIEKIRQEAVEIQSHLYSIEPLIYATAYYCDGILYIFTNKKLCENGEVEFDYKMICEY